MGTEPNWASAIKQRVRRHVRRLASPRPIVLMYHRIARQEVDPWELSVAPDNFARHLEILRTSKLPIVPLGAAADAWSDSRSLSKSVAITFDDGYVDNFLQAQPLLAQYDAPATWFVTSGYVGSSGEFWWDVLERVFLSTPRLPSHLQLDVPGDVRNWSLGAVADWSEQDITAFGQWRPFSPPPTARHAIHDELWKMLVDMPPEPRDRLLDQLLGWAGLGLGAREGRRPVSAEELQQADRGGHFEIGAHGISHRSLAAMLPDEQQKEFRDSKTSLEAIVGHRIRGFSYPQGRTIGAVEADLCNAGYTYACLSERRSVSRRQSPYRIPRVVVPNLGAGGFRWILGQFGLI